MKAALYARYSSDLQTENSIEAQKSAIYKYAASNGYDIVDEYIDRAKSGTTTKKRYEFNRMLKDCEKGRFQYVIVHKLDRFSRNRIDSLISKNIMQKSGVQLISVLEPLSGKAEDIIMESMLIGMAEYYSANLGREVMKGMMVKAKKCEHTGGVPPLGYYVDKETRKLAVNENEAVIVRDIFDMFVKGYSYRLISEELNKKGYKTKLGNDFKVNSIYEIIVNKKYCGYYIYNRASTFDENGCRNNHKSKSDDEIICIKGGVPAIISEETYEAAMTIIRKHKLAPAVSTAKRVYLLSGLIECGECGKTMTGNSRKGGSGNRYSSYRCSHYRNESCKNKEIKQESIEEYVLSQLEKTLFNEKNIPDIIESIKEYFCEREIENEKNITKAEKTIKEYEQRKNNIATAIASGVNADIFIEELQHIEEEIQRLNAEIDTGYADYEMPEITESMLKSAVKRYYSIVSDRNIPECKKIIANFVDKVVIYGEKVEVFFKFSPLFSSECGYTIKKSINRKFIPKAKGR